MVSNRNIPSTLLHPNGPKMSRMIYGTWRIADDDAAAHTATALLDRIKRCVSLGITSFDCADIYGGSAHRCESLFGEALALDASLRSNIQIVTKCGIVVPSSTVAVKHYNTTKQYIIKQLEDSLSALRTNYVDVLLIHRPSPLMSAAEVADAFQTLHSQGKVKFFGVSNFSPSQVDLIQSRLPFALVTNQIELHPLNMTAMHDGTLDHAQEKGMKPMIWSPLGQGRLMTESKDIRVSRVQEAIKAVASQLGPTVTVDQVAYAWLLMHPAEPVIVLGTNKIERIEQATGAIDLKLSHEQWFSIWQASAGQPVP